MKLNDLRELLVANPDKALQIILPTGSAVPVSFHITEIGLVQKSFIDCGGTFRELKTCQLQVWVGEDEEHRLTAKKASKIFEKAKTFLVDETLPVEIEYEDQVISQYQILDHQLMTDSVILKLGNKHTDCLAKELCGLPSPKQSITNSCANPKSGCCK